MLSQSLLNGVPLVRFNRECKDTPGLRERCCRDILKHEGLGSGDLYLEHHKDQQ